MDSNNDTIAVIGMACRFPGANNLDEFWNNLLDGKETIKRFSDEELSKFEFRFDEIKNNPNFVRARGILDNVDKFDAAFFGMTPKEATLTDPQHRVWLETAWEAFENAGCDPTNYPGAIGVFAGGCSNTYLLNNILRDPAILENYIRLRLSDSFQLFTGNDVSFIPTKTAYNFNLKGPAINVQTTCSTSLVAISEACQNLFSLKSDICLAGAICILVPQETGYIYQEGAIHSPDGYCRPFDAQARGTVFSNGVGAVVLKRLNDAIRDHDRIYAVVKGWSVNNDGNNKISYTAPSIDGQAEVVMMAQSFANILPEEISYIEAHGTGTQLGDPIEISGLKKAFEIKTNKKQFCGIGSVKGNIGHTDVAAGVASFIKTCLMAYHKKIPPTLNFSAPNPYIDFENSPFYVQKELKEWNEDRPLIMGVSSFGIGGTNAHVIIEEPPVEKKNNTTKSEWPALVLLSAKSENSLKRRKQDLIEFLNAKPDLNIHDVAFTLKTGRNHMPYRSFVVVDNVKEIISDENLFTTGKTDNLITNIAFMFPGQGAQYISMGKDLYNSNILFKQILDECFDIVKSETGEDIKTILFENTNIEEADRKLASTEITQPVLFIIEYALAKVFEQLDIRPRYLIGHSIGEYTAACIAGVFDMITALKIVIKRGQLMQRMQAGKMMAVRASVDQLRNLGNSCFEIAADNAPALCTISYKSENTERTTALLDKNDIKYIPLNTSHAFHSEAFDPILSEFSEFVNKFSLKAPSLPFISCLTGEFINKEQATSGNYWAQQLRNTVLFRNGISTISKNEDVIYLEVGPNTHLSSLVRQNKDVENKKAIIATLGKPDNIDEQYKILSSLGNMFIIGTDINFHTLQKDINPYKISLPTYPFEKIRHWIDFELSNTTEEQSHKATLSKNNIPATSHTPEFVTTKESENKSDMGKSIVLEIWKSMMGLKEIDHDDDFFELGGHSLLAIQILTRIKEELNANITLKTFYENPTINKLSSLLSDAVVINDKKVESVQRPVIMNLPLSFNQKRIWIISQLDGLNPAYNIPFTYHFTGDLNIDIFQKSINILFERHFIMFSVIKQKDGDPYCEIIPKPVVVELIDFPDDSSEKSRDRIYSFAGEDSRKLFDIESGPLYRLYLLKQDNTNFFFHATIHHLIFDGWSWSIFIQDFKKIYDSLILKKDIELEEVETHYLDFIRGLQDTDNKLHEEISTKFWVEYLRDCSPKLNFPYDYPRKDFPSGFGEKIEIKISPEFTVKLKEIARKEHATIFATLLSLVGVLFQRYSGENDICIGTALANRPYLKLEKIFGMFVNTVPIRIKINENIKFTNLINDTKNAILEAITHQELPFEKIVEVVNPERSYNMNPIFQVALEWLHNSGKPIDLEGTKGEHVTLKQGVSPFDITFYLWENGAQIEGEIEYNIDILEKNTIIRLRDNFLELINNLINNIDARIDYLPVISEKEIKTTLDFSGTRTSYPDDKTIIQLFEEQVSFYPNKIAAVFKGESLTYKQLNHKTNQFARTLRDFGVKNNVPVGILVEKSMEMIIGILAILKAGGVYVPIDPDYPEERINFIIEDSGCTVLLTQDKFMEANIGINKKISLNSPESYNAKKSDVERINRPSDLAYIMYTSGTTGLPKGTTIPHQGVVRLVRNTNYIEFTADDKILMAGALVFDATTFEIWGALLNGGTLFIVEKEAILNPEVLGEELLKNDITTILLTSSLFTQLAEFHTDIFYKLKNLIVGGDVLSAPHINKVRKDNPQLMVINAYGPTENSCISTYYRIDKDFDRNIPIGKPISNSTVYIFDKNMLYQPIGVIGELYVGGDGLSKGYLNRNDLNRTSFIDHPHIPGERLYRTGDHARWLPDGNIEFHGRVDNQLKIRGFRVELEEIESVIAEIDGVIETVVKPVKIEEGDYRLIAFLNVPETFNKDSKEISSRIKLKLPSYMIPSTYKFMNGFPQTINGKIDRKALAIDFKELDSEEREDVKTLTPTQKIMYKIWCEALKTSDISITDNFFEIGGNSLIAISVMSTIESEFNIELGLRVFFDSPKIKDLAETIDIIIHKEGYQKSFREIKGDALIVKGEI